MVPIVPQPYAASAGVRLTNASCAKSIFCLNRITWYFLELLLSVHEMASMTARLLLHYLLFVIAIPAYDITSKLLTPS